MKRAEIPSEVERRFWSRCDRSGGPSACWPWTGARSSAGYGQIRFGGRCFLAHQVACWLVGREAPPGLIHDHTCRNRACANPAHVEFVTFRENVLRGVGATAVHARKTACIRGHAFDEKNTIQVARGRECRACREERESRRPKRDRREYRRAYYHDHKGKAQT